MYYTYSKTNLLLTSGYRLILVFLTENTYLKNI